jgi:hypothetical protein
MRISVEESVLQHLPERALHKSVHELAAVQAHGVDGGFVVQSRAIHPFHSKDLRAGKKNWFDEVKQAVLPLHIKRVESCL